MDNSKSLVVAKKGIFQKIQELIKKIFKKETMGTPVNEEKSVGTRENFINDLKKNSNSDIKKLIQEIQNGEVNLEEKTDVELIEIENKLDKYLQYLNQEIKEKRAEINSLETSIAKMNAK